MRIALLGDVGLFGVNSVCNANIYSRFKKVSSYLSKFDLVIGNLETPFVQQARPYGYKSAHLRADIASIELLKYLNISLVNLSNNHIFDYGIKGFDSTVELLERNGIDFFGVNDKQAFFKKDGNHLAISGFCCYSSNGVMYKNKRHRQWINTLDPEAVETLIKRNIDEGYYNIVSMHMGEEHVNYPNPDHIEMARRLACQGPYLLYGHHPHVIQGIEEYRSSLLAYSLGNFCFDDVYSKKSVSPLVSQTDNNKTGGILEVEFLNNKIVDWKLEVIFDSGNEINFVGLEESSAMLERYSSLLIEVGNDYHSFRQGLVDAYVRGRKSKRNFAWYLKRMRLSSASQIVSAHLNKKRYYELVKTYVK